MTHGARAIEARANWKLYLDGAADGLHPFMTHRSYVAMAGRHRDDPYLGQFRKSPDLTGMYSVAYAGGHQFLDQRPGLPDRVWEVTRFLPGRESYLEALASSGRPEEEMVAQLERVAVAGMNVLIFPNLSLVGNSVAVIRPLAVGPDRSPLEGDFASRRRPGRSAAAPPDLRRLPQLRRPPTTTRIGSGLSTA